MQSEQGPGLHVGIIMDGNGRWAAQRGLPRVAGHRAGVTSVRRVVEHAPAAGIRCLTLYAFSGDNWRRPTAEVQSIFWIIRAFLRLEAERLRKNGVQLEVIGRRDRIPKPLLKEIEKAEWVTATGNRLLLRLAIDYSSRDAITCAALAVIRAGLPHHPPALEAFAPMLARALTEKGGDVDLLLRTGGEKRLSDFLLWESAYAELVFTDRMWPDFDEADLEAALEEFRSRERRFGGLPQLALSASGGAQ